MEQPRTTKRKGFTIFRSAAEEARWRDEEQSWYNEGGHMSCTSGRIVNVIGASKSFKVIMSREDNETFVHSFATMREAEAFVRRNTPRPPLRSTIYDRESGSS